MSIQITRLGPGEWENFHQRFRQWVDEQIVLDDSPASFSGPSDYFAATAAAYQALLAETLARGQELRPLGGGWSFNDLAGTAGWLADTQGLEQVFSVDEDIGPGAPAGRHFVLASGGCSIRTLNKWLDANHLSLRTSGASNGQSIAGAIATGTHGAVPSMGGMQAHVAGLHLVTGPNSSVWLEPARAPRLRDAFANRFAGRVIRDDRLFDAAVVHLGGMGIVNAVLLDVVPRFHLEIVQRKKRIDAAWLSDIEAGDFESAARRIGENRLPYFWQIILNPFDPFGSAGLHRMYFEVPPPLVADWVPLGAESVGEPLNILARIFEQIPSLRGEGIALMMNTLFAEVPWPPPPLGRRVLQFWGETTPDYKRHGDIYSASIAVPRNRLSDVLDVMFPAFREEGGGDFVFTLRFVDRSDGTLAFTRFDDNVVIDMDGMYSAASVGAGDRIFAALAASGIPHGHHWGKLGPIDAAGVRAHFPTGADAWIAARKSLLEPAMQAVFRNDALGRWGLA